MSLRVDDPRLFFEVARARSITTAARQLDLPKSTVSRRLIQFEEALGIRLFHKTTRRITLTELGERYFERCERVVREIEETRDFLESVTTRASGALRVTMPTDIGIHWLADFFVAFARVHPEVSLALDFTGRRVDLVGERFDVAIRAGALPSSDMPARKLTSLDRMMCASPDYLRVAGTPRAPADLARHRFVLLEAHTQSRSEIELRQRGKTARVPMLGPIVSNSLGVLHAITREGGGIGLIPKRMCGADLAAGRLVTVLPGWAPRPVDLHYVILSRTLMPAKTRLFVEKLAAHFKGLERSERAR
jgi:DNA-binding transcriptional LysR family regulator